MNFSLNMLIDFMVIKKRVLYLENADEDSTASLLFSQNFHSRKKTIFETNFASKKNATATFHDRFLMCKSLSRGLIWSIITESVIIESCDSRMFVKENPDRKKKLHYIRRQYFTRLLWIQIQFNKIFTHYFSISLCLCYSFD